MASAALASRNETNWSHNKKTTTQQQQQTSSSFQMGKFPPFLNPNPNRNPNLSNLNPNHNSRKQLHQNGGVKEETASFHRQQQPQQRDDSFSHRVSIDISRYSKSEIRELKSKLMSELDRVRNLSSRIESGSMSKKRPSPFPSKDAKRFAGAAVVNGNHDSNHNHRQPPPSQQPPRFVASMQLMKMCMTILKKLMNQKLGFVFSAPVDVVGMGLHDYYTVIKKPMDLGTIKKALEDGKYDAPEEFAADVRLTFNNALLYNPKGHEVNELAQQYMALFEKWYQPIHQKVQAEKQLFFDNLARKNVAVAARSEIQKEESVVEDEVPVPAMRVGSWSKMASPEPPKMKKQSPKPEPVAPVPVPVPVRTPTPPPMRREPSPLPQPPAMTGQKVESVERERVERRGRGRGPGGKLPKPKAKDPNKREMSMEEKQNLGFELQHLPDEKMIHVIQIIKKRNNGQLTQEGDEIELDIEASDTETLWELDRFVTNHKKAVSKLRRQALIDSLNNNNVGHLNDEINQVDGGDRMAEMAKAKRGDLGEEDVDIGDEMPVNHFPPVQIDKEDDDRRQHHGGAVGGGGGDDGSSSSDSGSSSDDSSSSDSDSGSSSGSDSDVDDAQSRDNESKNVHR